MLRLGVALADRHLVAALQLPGSQPCRLLLKLPRTLDGHHQLVEVVRRDPLLEVVLPDLLLDPGGLAEQLHHAGVPLWVIPRETVEALRHLLAIDPTTHASQTLARVYARMPATRFGRHLRPWPPPDPRQLALIHPPA